MTDPTLLKPVENLIQSCLKNQQYTTNRKRKEEERDSNPFLVHDSPIQHDTLQCQIWLQKVEWFRRDLLDKARTCEHKQTDRHKTTMIQYTFPFMTKQELTCSRLGQQHRQEQQPYRSCQLALQSLCSADKHTHVHTHTHTHTHTRMHTCMHARAHTQLLFFKSNK